MKTELYRLIDRLERSGDWEEINELIKEIQTFTEKMALN